MSGHADTIKQIRHSTCGVFRERDTDTWYDALTAAEAALREVEALRAELATLRERVEDARRVARDVVTIYDYSEIQDSDLYKAARRILAHPAPAQPTCATCDGTGRWCGTDCRDVRCSPCAPCPSCTPAPTCATCGGVGRVNEITPGLPSVPCPACKARP